MLCDAVLLHHKGETISYNNLDTVAVLPFDITLPFLAIERFVLVGGFVLMFPHFGRYVQPPPLEDSDFPALLSSELAEGSCPVL